MNTNLLSNDNGLLQNIYYNVVTINCCHHICIIEYLKMGNWGQKLSAAHWAFWRGFDILEYVIYVVGKLIEAVMEGNKATIERIKYRTFAADMERQAVKDEAAGKSKQVRSQLNNVIDEFKTLFTICKVN